MVTSRLQEQKKVFFFYLTKFKSVLLSKVYKRNILKKLGSQEGVIIAFKIDETAWRNFHGKRSSCACIIIIIIWFCYISICSFAFGYFACFSAFLFNAIIFQGNPDPFSSFFFFVTKIPLSWHIGYVMEWSMINESVSESVSERCMYVKPIRLDLL